MEKACYVNSLDSDHITIRANSMAYGTRRFNTAFTIIATYPELKRWNISYLYLSLKMQSCFRLGLPRGTFPVKKPNLNQTQVANLVRYITN